MEDYVTKEGEKQGRYISPDPLPEKGYYFLSDQFSFAKVGVPALFAWDGEDYEGEGKEYGKSVDDDYIKHHYHQPSDEYNPAWTFEGGIQNIDLLFRIGKRLASESSWPKWKSDSEFKPIRDKEMSDK